MTSTIIPRPRAHYNHRAYLSTGQAASYAGVCRNTIKALIATGELQGYQTDGGHWRISTASLLAYVDGIEQEEQPSELSQAQGVVIYARVSSDKQASDGALIRQEERLRKEVSEREGVSPEALPIDTEGASSFGIRPGVYALVDSMLEGRIKKIYCEYLDRLSRTPSLTYLIQHLAKRHGVEVICLDIEETNPEELEYLTKELISFITVVSNRVSAAKSRRVTVKEVDEETLKRIFELRGQGCSYVSITKKIKAEGLRTVDGEEISYSKVTRLIANGRGRAFGAAVGVDVVKSPQEILRDWLREALGVVGDEKSKERVYSFDVKAAYDRYCEAVGLEPLPSSEVCRGLHAVYPNRKFRTMGRNGYRGLAFVERE